ncbi:MAG: PAS domain S-box protein [Planctomycetota bacterium]|nr:MAG: PAS domain S-box protein [Planctomycetota bacterium]
MLREGLVVGLANHTALTATDGSVRPIEDSAAPIKDEKGRTLGVVLVFRDATEKRKIEKETREADRNKDEFLAMLAHELRNPLAPLHNALQILRMRGVDAATAERARGP